MGRGTGWKPDEDMSLMRSFLDASEEFRAAVDLKLNEFWDQVLHRFLTYCPGSKRTLGALQTRWRILQEAVSRFCEVFHQIASAVDPNKTDDDCVNEALAQYEGVQGVPFEHRCIWEFLRKEIPEYEDRLGFASSRSKRRKRPDEQPQSQHADIDDQEPGIPRSGGHKKARKLVELEESMVAIQKAYVAQAKRRNELLAEQNRLLEQMIERQARVSLAGLQTEGMDEDGKKLVQTARKIELRTLLDEAEDAGIDVQ